jgi:hypothetical protein
MVQTCKKGLWKICLTRNKEDWDLAFPYIAMGYRMSKHTSMFHFSLYFLLFGRHPIPPSSIAAQMDQVVDLDSPTTWVKVIAKRAALFRRVMPMAMENLSCRNSNLAKCGGEAQHLEKLGIWSPPGLPNVQSSTARGKTPCIGVFLVSLKRS